MKESTKQIRLWTVDFARGTAIVLMIVYHFLFDLNFLGIAQLDFQSPALVLFQRIIAVLFLGVVGISLAIGKQTLKQDAIRAAKLGLIALLITVATAIYPGKGIIVFGIIHFIAISVLLGHFFARFGKWNAAIGIAIVAIWAVLKGNLTGSLMLLPLGFPPTGFYTLDYYPVFPWFSLVLFGIAFASTGIIKKAQEKFAEPAKHSPSDRVRWMGRHSLAIYLLHQPIIFCILIAARYLL
ncbi:MAG: heparan-alpha-glucosaminide N-acetyltransferase [Candidatus Micrarchaeia archaeon]|jgi:uncharacterized membrane protein